MTKSSSEETIGMKIAGANWDGDIDFLTSMEEAGRFNPLEVTSEDKWNYLHRINIWNPSPVETVRFYLDRGVEVNAQDGYGMTPLHYALRTGNGDAALVLLEAGADPNIADRDNIIPLAMIGAIPDRLDVLKLMLEKGGNVHYLNGNNDISILEFNKRYLSDDKQFAPIIKMMEAFA